MFSHHLHTLDWNQHHLLDTVHDSNILKLHTPAKREETKKNRDRSVDLSNPLKADLPSLDLVGHP